MNILQIVPKLEVGGVERGTVDLAKNLLTRDHKAVVISAGGELVGELTALGIRHYQLPVDKKSPLTIFKMIFKAAEIIKKERIDIIHARSRVPAWIAYFASYKTACKFITTCHGYYNTHFTSQVMGWGKSVIVTSVAIGRHMIDDFKVPPERIRYIPRGVDLEKFNFNPSYLRKRNTFNIGIIARLTPLKGHRYFLKAISKVIRCIPKVRAFVIGEASPNKARYKEELLILVRQLGISSYVEFLGKSSDIPKALLDLDVLVMATTTHEAFGRVIIEANAVGVPVIATKVGGVVDIIEDDKNGLLVSPKDPEAIAKNILRLHKNKELVKSLTDEARKKTEELFSLAAMVDKTLDVYKETLNSIRILVIKLSALGDVVLAIPSLKALKKKFPSSHISVLVDLNSKDALKNCPYVNEILAYDFKASGILSRNFFDIAGGLRKESFDIIIDLQNNSKSHLLGFLSMSPKRYGYKNKKLGFLLNSGIKDINEPLDPIKHQERVLNMLGVDILDKSLKLYPALEDIEFIQNLLKDEWLAENQILIGLNITASKKWQSKRWPLKNFVKLSDELTKKFNARIVITGTPKDREEIDEFLRLVKNKPIIARGKTTFMQFAALVNKCRVFITGDSAPMHVAASVNTPFVALFGPTDPKRHLPPAKDYTLIYKSVKCSPCYKPNCRNNICMKNISVDEVLEVLKKYLKTK